MGVHWTVLCVLQGTEGRWDLKSSKVRMGVHWIVLHVYSDKEVEAEDGDIDDSASDSSL